MQNWGFKTVFRFMAIVGVLAGMLTILGCPGGEEEQVEVAAADIEVPLNPTTVRTIDDQAFTFPSGAPAVFPGFPALATQRTTVTFDTTPATPTATVTATNVRDINGNLGARYTATATFTASCVFTVTVSTFPVGQGPQVGDTIMVNPCEVNVETGGVQATGQTTTVQILIELGLSRSAEQQAQVSINPDTGVVTVNDINTGQSVTLVVSTGAAGG